MLKKIILLLPILAVALVILEIVFSTELAATSTQAKLIEQKTSDLKKENEEYSLEIASNSALLVIAEKAKALGLSENATSEFFSTLPVAYHPALH